MLDFLKGLKRFSIATIIVSAIMGVLFIAFPSKCIQYISLVVGVSLIVTGIISVVSYIVERDTKLPLVLGTISLISGIIVCAKYQAIISIIIVILGIFILTSGIVDMATSIRSIMIFRKSIMHSDALYHISTICAESTTNFPRRSCNGLRVLL